MEAMLVASVQSQKILFEANFCGPRNCFLFCAVAINLIVQHIQDILNGGQTKRQNGFTNGYSTPRQRRASESSSRPH